MQAGVDHPRARGHLNPNLIFASKRVSQDPLSDVWLRPNERKATKETSFDVKPVGLCQRQCKMSTRLRSMKFLKVVENRPFIEA